MLVQCPECTTKYNLDESKIGHDGSKVRCTRCKNVFTVFRPISEDVVTPEIPEPAPGGGAFENDSFDDDLASAFEDKKSAPAAEKDSFEDELNAMFEDVKSAPVSRKSADANAFEDDLAAMLDGQTSKPAPKSSADESFEDDLTAMLDEKRSTAGSKSSVDQEMIADLQGAFQQPLSDQLDQDLRSTDSSAGKSRKSGNTGLMIGLVVLLLACGLGAVYFFQPGLLGLAPSVPDAPATQDTVAREGAAQIALENVRQYFSYCGLGRNALSKPGRPMSPCRPVRMASMETWGRPVAVGPVSQMSQPAASKKKLLARSLSWGKMYRGDCLDENNVMTRWISTMSTESVR